MIDCRLHVGGAPFADSAATLAAGVPTALADLDLTWGRATTVDQPDAATCRFTVLDRAGGATVTDALPIGATVEVWAAGDIGTGAPRNVAVDGGFEAAPLGPAGNRAVLVAGSPGTLAVIAAPVHAGAHALALAATVVANLAAVVPPAPFAPGTPTAWDEIPRLGSSQWRWSVAVLAARASTTNVGAIAFDGPEDVGATGGPLGPLFAVPGDGTWHDANGYVTAAAPTAAAWLGVTVATTLAAWQTLQLTWQQTPGTWDEYGRTVTDDVVLEAPPSVIRDVLVFAGRITDLAATVAPAAAEVRVDVIAVDQLADLQNRYVGAQPWPAETVTARVGHVLEGAALTVATRIDAALGTLVVSKRDVDRQPAGALLTELAAGVDGVLWSATHATLGAFLWLEDVASRVALGTLQLVGGFVVIVVDTAGNRPPGRTTLDGCELAADGVTWHRDVTDVLTRVDATWLEQLTPPVEHTVTVVDAPAEAPPAGSTRRIGVTTQLTAAADATDVGNRILARTHMAQWRAEGLEVDCARFPPAAGADTADVLDLLDGTTRLGRGLIVENIVGWPGGDAAGAYLDGGSYRYDGAWRLAMATSPMGGFGESAPWQSLEPSWQWAQFSPDLAWSDLFGVTGPLQPPLTLARQTEVTYG